MVCWPLVDPSWIYSLKIKSKVLDRSWRQPESILFTSYYQGRSPLLSQTLTLGLKRQSTHSLLSHLIHPMVVTWQVARYLSIPWIPVHICTWESTAGHYSGPVFLEKDSLFIVRSEMNVVFFCRVRQNYTTYVILDFAQASILQSLNRNLFQIYNRWPFKDFSIFA